MELRLIENEKNRIKLEIRGEGHTFCNALRKELWKDKAVEIAGYTVEHSLVSEPILTLEMGKGEAKKALLDAVERLHKQNGELLELFKKI